MRRPTARGDSRTVGWSRLDERSGRAIIVRGAEMAKAGGRETRHDSGVCFEGMEAQQLLSCRHLPAFLGARAPVLIRVRERLLNGIPHACLKATSSNRWTTRSFRPRHATRQLLAAGQSQTPVRLRFCPTPPKK